ncbi:MAG: sortase, partial [Butyrivibrio sp.]|nr:sortase [Butyrivibrio sp.]
AASDGNSRTWTGPYKGDSNRYYVSNGTVAYTVDNDQGKTIIDVVGQFSKGGKAYMVQTTRSGEGWTIITDADAAPASGSFASGTADLDELYLGFSEDAPARLCVEADLGSLEKALAIGTDCAIGNEEIRDNVPLAGTLIADLNSQRNITKVSYIGIGSRDAAQSAMNNDRGTEYPAVSLVPVTVHGLRAWINNTGTPEPYKFADGTSTVKVDGQDFTNVKLLCENSAANEAMSLINAEPGDIVSFNFEIGSLATATSFKNVKDARYEYTANSSNIKNGKLLGDELRKYAITVAEPMDSVLELMKIKTPASVKSGLSSKVRALTSSSSNSYKADYLDISILQTSDNATYNNKTVTEVRKDSKDAGSAVMPLKIELTYDFSNKETVKLFREHNGTIEELTESNSGTDGTYVLNENAGKIYIYSYKFSQFAVAYKQEVYYTVTFDDGTSKTSVKVKDGEKVSKPADPSKEGYTFKGWYLKGSSSSASVFNFDTAITKDTNLVAGWTAAKDKKSGTDDDSDENDSRAPKTGDSLPAVWLWVIVLAAGVVTFSLSLREIINSENPEGSGNKSPSGLKRALLLLGILVIATARFVARKIKQNKAKALLTASGAVVIVSLIVLASTMLQYKTAEDLYIDAEETYVETASEELSLEQTEVETAKEHGWWDCVDVNVEELAQEYPDVVGWIYFENEDISYPIMYSGDNAKYLSTAYTGEKAKAGAIFIDGESTPDFSDPHSLVYGHNMRDLSMFGKLRYYKNTPGYYEDHQYFQVFTKDSVYRYQIFACEVVPDSHDVFWVFGKEPTDYWKMLKEVERDSFINTDIRANESDHVITLATCTNNDDERLIVCAVRTDAYQYQQ